MIKILSLILVFVVVVLLDGQIFPAVFGFREGVLVMVFLLAMLLNWGPTAAVLWLGSGFSVFLEFFWKLQPGSLLLFFLLSALIYYFISSSFNVKRYFAAAILSFGALAAFWHNGFIGVITVFVGFAACFLIFDYLCSEKKNTKFL